MQPNSTGMTVVMSTRTSSDDDVKRLLRVEGVGLLAPSGTSAPTWFTWLLACTLHLGEMRGIATLAIHAP